MNSSLKAQPVPRCPASFCCCLPPSDPTVFRVLGVPSLTPPSLRAQQRTPGLGLFREPPAPPSPPQRPRLSTWVALAAPCTLHPSPWRPLCPEASAGPPFSRSSVSARCPWHPGLCVFFSLCLCIPSRRLQIPSDLLPVLPNSLPVKIFLVLALGPRVLREPFRNIFPGHHV